jgi:hypothetical protein
LLAFCLPVWASLSITLTAVLTITTGGGAHFSKAFAAGAVVAVVVWLWRRHQRQQALKQTTANLMLLAIPAARTKHPEARQRRTERQAA